MDKILELLKLFEKFGVKPGKIIGAGDRKVTPIKRPILSKPLNRDYLLEDVEEGKIGINTVKNEIEDVAPLFFQKQLNDVEINNLISNLNYLDNLLNPTNIVNIKTKQPVKGLDSLSTSVTEDLKTAGKQLEEKGKELEQVVKPKSIIGDIMKDYGQFQKVMQDARRTGYVRATVREIMREDIKAGKLKLPKELEDQIMQGLGEPIDVWRKVYGEGALEQIDSIADDIGQLRTEMDAAKLARSKFKFEPDVNRPSGSYTPEEDPSKIKNIKLEMDKRTNIDDLIDEYNANQDRLSLTDEEGGTAIGYDEFRKLQDRNKQIADALENKGISSKIEEEVKPEGIVIPFKKKITEPEEKAEGGIIRAKFAKGGKGKKILDIINEVNKKLKGKKSMETVNPKTGEVTVPKNPVTVAQKYNQDIIKAADEIYPSYDDPKIAADQIVDSYAQMKYGLEDQYGLSNKERMDLYRQAYDYVMDYNRGAVGKTAGKSINISDEKTAKAFTDFARENDPEGFKKIQKIVDDINNKNALDEFEIIDRKPNASGGLNYLMGF